MIYDRSKMFFHLYGFTSVQSPQNKLYILKIYHKMPPIPYPNYESRALLSTFAAKITT